MKEVYDAIDSINKEESEALKGYIEMAREYSEKAKEEKEKQI